MTMTQPWRAYSLDSHVMKKTLDEPTPGTSAEIGYYPAICDIATDRLSIETLSGHAAIVAEIESDANVVKGWIYPGAQQHRDFMSGEARSMPYTARVFGLPKTHVLTLHQSDSQDELDFVVWCLSFFSGIRLTTTEAGFLDATPIKLGTLVDFVLSDCTLTDALHLSLNYMESWRSEPRALKRVAAAIHALFLAQYPQNLPFERFQYLFMSLDACFSLASGQEAKKPNIGHARRIKWMCDRYGMPIPDWTVSAAKGTAPVSTVRNDVFHEALFFEQPLGFAICDGNQPQASIPNIDLEMQGLVCRLLIAILGKPSADYVRTPIASRMLHALKVV